MRLGRVRLRLRGRNVERFVNHSVKKGVNFLSVSRDDNVMDVVVDYAQYKNTIKYAKAFTLESVEYMGLCRVLRFLADNIGVIVGIVLAVAICSVAMTRVWRIEIFGLERIEKQSIVDILDEMHYNIGSSVYDIDNKAIEDRLLENFEDLSMVSVMHQGCSIIISAKEKEYQPDLDPALTLPVVAKCDGIVESIVVSQGTPMVKVGDVVRAGDVLIAPFVVDKDGNATSMRAMGTVKAVVYVKGSVTYQDGQERLVRSGAVTTRKHLTLLGMYFPSRTPITYEYYDTEVCSRDLCKNMILPFEVQEEKCYELIKVRGGTFDQEKDFLIKESIYKAYEMLDADFDVQSEQTDITEVAGTYFVTTYLKVLTDIA